jgi:hypothetical protein
MAWGRQKSGGAGIAWLALIVALLALYVAWSAYRRTGGDLDGLVRLDRGEAGMSADWRASLERARKRLLERRPDVEGEQNLEQVRRDVAEIRESLEKTYRNAGEGAREKWRTLDGELERLEGQLRNGSSRAKETLDSLLDKMRT